MKAVKKIEISVLHKRITPVVYAVQGDTGREIECTVVDWDIPSGVAARVWVVKPSKKVVYNDCRIVDKAVFVPLTNQTLAEPGGAICMIEFVSGEDVVSSFSFNLYVYESVSGDGIPSENESTVLEQMFEELAQDAIKTLEAAKAEAAAAKKSAQDTEKIKNDFTLTAQQATADVNNAGQTQTQRVNEAGDTQVSRVQSEGTTQVKNVQAAAAEISSDREQIHTNRDNTAQLQRTTASAIIREAEGRWITLEDAAEGKGYRKLDVQGMTVQDGVPTPEAEVPLENVGVLNKDGKYEVTVTACGKNLINVPEGKTVANNSPYHICGLIPGQTYTLTLSQTLVTAGNDGGMKAQHWIKFTAKDGSVISQKPVAPITFTKEGENIVKSETFVVPDNTYKVMIDIGTYYTNATNIQTLYCQLEDGDTATQYTPYKGRTATVTSDRPLTQWDKLTCRDGVWGWAYGGDTDTFDGSADEKWYRYYLQTAGVCFYISNDAYLVGSQTSICNRYKNVNLAWQDSSKGQYGIYSDHISASNKYFRPPNVEVTTIEQWRAWLAENPVILQYQLAEEEWEPLTDQEQSAMNALCSYAGTTHIWTDDPLQPVISLEYTVDTETYIRETAPAYTDIGKVAVTGEASGEFVTCRDSAEWPLLDLELYGKTEQVKTTGAQLLRITAPSKTQNGITFTVEKNGMIAIKGTATANVNINLGNVTLQPGTYTLSGCPTGGNNTKYQLVLHGGENIYDTGKTAAFSVTDESNMTAAFYVYAGTKVDFSVKPMLNAGDTALPWEPYTGAAPSPSPEYPQELETTGSGGSEVVVHSNTAQLLDHSQYVIKDVKVIDGITLTPNLDGTFVANGKASQNVFFSPLTITSYMSVPRGIYTFSGCPKVDGCYIQIKDASTDEELGVEKGAGAVMDLMSETRIRYNIRFKSGAIVNNVIFKPMLNAGTSALPFVPYVSQSFPIPTPGGLAGLPVSDEADYNYVDEAGDKWLCDVAGYEQDGQIGVLRNCIVWNPDTISLLNDTYVDTSLYQAVKKELPALRGGSLYPGLCNRLQYRYNTGDTLHFYWDNNTSTPKVYLPKGYTPNPEDFEFLGALITPVFEPYPPEVQRKIRQLHTYDSVTHIWTNEDAGITARYVKNGNLVLGTLEDRLTALEAGQAQTAAAFSYLPPETQAAMIENETSELLSKIQEEEK